jgi:uncharacterized ion transporter superfamily protein YfcC
MKTKVEKTITYIILGICTICIFSVIYLYHYESKLKDNTPKFSMFEHYENSIKDK